MRAVSTLLAVLAVSLVGCGSGARVVVPRILEGTRLTDAYATLHKAGLRVAVRYPTSARAGSPGEPTVLRVSPRGGSPIAAGGVVTVAAGDRGTVVSPIGVNLEVRVRTPNLVGKSAAAAIAWTQAHDVLWSMKLPNLPPSDAANLYDAYWVVAQAPGNGKLLIYTSRPGPGLRQWLSLKVAPR